MQVRSYFKELWSAAVCFDQFSSVSVYFFLRAHQPLVRPQSQIRTWFYLLEQCAPLLQHLAYKHLETSKDQFSVPPVFSLEKFTVVEVSLEYHLCRQKRRRSCKEIKITIVRSKLFFIEVWATDRIAFFGCSRNSAFLGLVGFFLRKAVKCVKLFSLCRLHFVLTHSLLHDLMTCCVVNSWLLPKLP